MTLEKFFRDGNKLVIGGSTAYWPENCDDVDFAIFTPYGDNPKHIDEKSVVCFVKANFPFSNYEDIQGHSPHGFRWSCGPIGQCSPPYNIDKLPSNHPDLDHFFLIGKFFPNRGFIDMHYRNIFCFKPELRTWLRMDRDFRNQSGSHLHKKPHKTLAMMITAIENLDVPATKPLIDYYWRELNSRKWSADSRTDREEARKLYDVFVSDAKLNLPIGPVLRLLEKYNDYLDSMNPFC